jgi:hypothetical protein
MTVSAAKHQRLERTVMKRRKLTRISLAAGLSGVLAASLAGMSAATASAATTAAAHHPAWHTVLSVPNGAKPGLVTTVIATGKTSGWAFLRDSKVAYERTGANRWKAVELPGAAGTVQAAGASSPANVWIAYKPNGGGAPQLYRWNGWKWTLEKSLEKQALVTGISVLGPHDVWVFGGLGFTGELGVSHFNGHQWKQLSATLEDGSALSDNNVWAFAGTQVDHFNGRKWSAVNVGQLLPPAPVGSAVGSYLTSIAALAPDNVYATSQDGNSLRGPAALLHFNGRSWTRVAESASFTNIPWAQLASDGRGGVWIAAQNPGPVSEEGSSARLVHYSRGKVTVVPLPGGAASGTVSRIPGTAEALAGGVRYGTGYGTSVVFQYS